MASFRYFNAAAAAAALALMAACAPPQPRIYGGPAAPAGPGTLWPVPAPARTPPPADTAPASPEAARALAADAETAGGVRELALTEVVELALRNNPATRESYATARAAADVYGSARGQLYPTIDADVDLTRSVTRTSGGASGGSTGGGSTGGDSTGTGGGSGGGGSGGGGGSTTVRRLTLTPSVSLSYLVFDFGGRAGSIEAARERAIEASLEHNATVRDVVLQVESALFSFLATRALRDAQQVAVTEAQADLAAAEERHRVGVSSIQEVLQTRTALSQARLQLQTLEADYFSARGNLAVAMGLQANTRFTIPEVTADESVANVAANVDALIARATAERPELALARAEARALAAEVRVARSAGYPALFLRSNATATRTFQPQTATSRGYTISLGVQIPIFDGFSRQFDVRAARERYDAQLARVTGVRQQISLQVFTDYYALQAATQRVHTSTSLVADAAQSATVAAGRYRSGVGTIVDVLLARSALATARAEAIQARWEWRTALVQLGHDTGSLDLAGRPNLLIGTDTTGTAP
ncbi:TolC family protein [Longimicrobium sp.]|uniref:TolC family protein n=1 Tax=Longimicrobium sp. TaxID=2029185 RepID=UPI002B62B548|nr:TolC family protein [Longimicrobium sp.]HSU13265.1 TolC family protein [Longimicrobium sp.]